MIYSEASGALLSPFTQKSGSANKRHPSLSPLASADETILGCQMGKRIFLNLATATINPKTRKAAAISFFELLTLLF